MKKIHKSVSMVSGGLIAACSVQAFAQVHDSVFSGWVRKSTCSIQVRTGLTGKPKIITAAQASSFKLNSDQYVRAIGKGTAELRIFGHELLLKESNGWYRMPRDVAKAPKGKDAYVRFTSTAGLPRGDELNAENYWRSINLIDLQNPNKASKVRIRTRVKRVNKDGSPLSGKQNDFGDETLKKDEWVVIELANDSAETVFVTIFDVDLDAKVWKIVPEADAAPIRLGQHSSWTRVSQPLPVGLPAGFTSGVENLKVIATLSGVDLSALASHKGLDTPVTFELSNDPLQNFLRTASGKSRLFDIRDWNVATIELKISYK